MKAKRYNQYKINLICITFLVLFSNNSFARQFIEKDHIIIDLLSGVEWLRCSTGQIWDGENCSGEIVRLNLDEVEQAINQANDQLEGIWRLPSREELEGLICSTCLNAKIDKIYFPSTPREPFWTSDKNYWSEGRYWTVNFFTGFSFSRFTTH